MKRERKPKSIHYKRADVGNGKDLQQLLTDVLLTEQSQWYKACNRQQFISDDSDVFYFINHRSEHQNMFFAELLCVEKGKSQSFMRLDDESGEFKIIPLTVDGLPEDEIADEKQSQSRREFVDSILYFGVVGNHVAVIQSRAIRHGHLEKHLGWLLGSSSSGAMPQDQALILYDSATVETQEKLRQSPAKHLIIGSDVGSQQLHKSVGQEEQIKADSVSFAVDSKLQKVLRAVGIELNQVKLEDALDNANLRMKIVLTYDRRTSKSGQQVIDTVASSLRNFDDTDYVIKLANNTVIRAGEMRIQGRVMVETINGTIDNSNLKIEVYNWLQANALPHE